MSSATTTHGPLALIGGGEWQFGSLADEALVERAGDEVVILPTAAAFERPERAIATAEMFYKHTSVSVRPCMVLTRSDAENEALAGVVRDARFIYLAGGSPLHLRATLKDSAVLHALIEAWRSGALIAGSSAGAMVLTDPMVDPRGGAFTVGFGLIRDLSVVPHYRGDITAQLRRTLTLAPDGCAIVAIAEQSAVIREPDGIWTGFGQASIFLDGELDSLSALAGKGVV